MGKREDGWAAAMATTLAAEPWLAFRYLLAQQYNGHKPQRHQGHTKKRAADMAGVVIAALGGDIRAQPTPEQLNTPAWVAFTVAVEPMGPGERRSLMRLIADARWSESEDLHFTTRCLLLNLRTMQHMQKLNNADWNPISGYPKKRTGRGRSGKWKPRR